MVDGVLRTKEMNSMLVEVGLANNDDCVRMSLRRQDGWQVQASGRWDEVPVCGGDGSAQH